MLQPQVPVFTSTPAVVPSYIPDAPVVSQWYDPAHTILHITYIEGWTWRDALRHDREVVIPTLQGLTHPVALIYDFCAAPLMPPRGFAENVKQSAMLYAPLQIDIVVFALPQTSTATLLETAYRHYNLSNRVYTSAVSVSEAAHKIHQQRS